jgi:hypothetical protein
VYVNIFRSGGEDTQFACLREPTQPAIKSATARKEEDLTGYKAQCSIKELFSKTFEGLTPGQSMSQEVRMTMSEVVDSVNDVFKRAEEYQGTARYVGEHLVSVITPHKILASSFMWWRGSRIFRNIQRESIPVTGLATGYFLPLSTLPSMNYGWAPAYNAASPLRQQEAVSLPWYCAVPYVATIGQGNAYILGIHQHFLPVGLAISLTQQGVNAISAGDDFEMLYQVPWANRFVTLLAEENKRSKNSSRNNSSSSSNS